MPTHNESISKTVITERNDQAGGSHLGKVQSHYFLQSEQTNGAYSLTEIVFQPGSQGTPLHIHHREEETYYVIEGALEVQVGEQQTVLGPGGSVVLPRGLPHRVAATGNTITRALMIISPPGLEQMLLTLDKLHKEELDMDTLQRLAVEYGIELLPSE